MRRMTLWLLSFFSLAGVHAQDSLSWAVLQDVVFEYKHHEQLDAYLLAPTFGERVSAFDGRKVVISGFIIPLDVEAQQYVLSGVTMNACFFCGGAGPESVMELSFAHPHRAFETDEYLTFTGTLRLNQTEVERLTYILEDAKLLE